MSNAHDQTYETNGITTAIFLGTGFFFLNHDSKNGLNI